MLSGDGGSQGRLAGGAHRKCCNIKEQDSSRVQTNANVDNNSAARYKHVLHYVRCGNMAVF